MIKELVVGVLGALGIFFSLSGAVGILRMPDLYTRVQCSSKNVTLGAVPILVAVVIAKGFVTPYANRAVLVAFLLFVVNPAASHALTRAAYRIGVPMWAGSVQDEPRDQ